MSNVGFYINYTHTHTRLEAARFTDSCGQKSAHLSFLHEMTSGQFMTGFVENIKTLWRLPPVVCDGIVIHISICNTLIFVCFDCVNE